MNKEKLKSRDDVVRDTFNHIKRVGTLLMEIVTDLQKRAINHDTSKFSESEFPYFAEETQKLKNLVYDSEEYKQSIKNLGPALEHHYSWNDHHPEYHKNGIKDMNLIQLLELLSDWRAASERHAGGSLNSSIDKNAARFGYDENMVNLLKNTARYLGWI
jgi:hypothetical protein